VSDVDPLVALSAFGAVLRAAGVAADAGRIASFSEALSLLEASRPGDVYWAGRLTLCSDPDDLPRYDAAFAAVFGGQPVAALEPADLDPVVAASSPAATDGPPAPPGGDGERLRAAASSREVLRIRDIATLSAQERVQLARLLAAFSLPGELRPSRRQKQAQRGPIDRRRTIRAATRTGGEVMALHYRRPHQRPRRVVLLVDISGSMAAYADALLRFAHAARRASAPVEVFTLGTRLTRVTRELSHRDPEVALRAVSVAVPDWSGGTRLGVLMRSFLDVWGQRGLARGAIVVVLSDGWERGDPQLLGEQMARLHRLAHRVIWANPLRARPGYEPLAAGMAAALPHVDDFVAGHSIEALERLAALLAGPARRQLAAALA
jgi:uncharacterized protein with von Willebrand factor type A (vWA) domain